VTLLRQRKLKDLLAAIPAYPLIRGALPFDAARRDALGKAVGAAVSSLAAKGVTTVDGWRLAYEDGWALVRFSGTEPKVRVTAEAREAKRAQEIYDRVFAAVKGALA